MSHFRRLLFATSLAKLNVSNSLRETETGESFTNISLDRRHLRDHQRLAVATERVLQEVSELGVAVRNEVLLRPQRVDDVTKRRQTLVDVLRFLQSSTVRSRFAHSLRSSQIHQVENTFNNNKLVNKMSKEHDGRWRNHCPHP